MKHITHTVTTLRLLQHVQFVAHYRVALYPCKWALVPFRNEREWSCVKAD